MAWLRCLARPALIHRVSNEPTSAGPRLLGPADVRLLAERYEVRPTKKRGQNFVIDANTVRRIVAAAELRPDDRVLEVGPKYGVHARWIDRELRPSGLVFSDFESDAQLHAKWVDSLTSPHRFVYGDLRKATELTELEPFDLVFFLGVLYHSIHHLPLLGMLNRVTKPGGTMLFETTIDSRPDALVRLRWPENGKAKGVPTVQAVRLELAWTGWRKVTRFTDYRPGSSEALFLCEKTDELRGEAELSDVVTPHRPG